MYLYYQLQDLFIILFTTPIPFYYRLQVFDNANTTI